MGLDMCLKAKVYIGGEYHYIKEKQLTVSQVMKRFSEENYDNAFVLPTENLSSLEFEIGYWRKAYQIHDWFVNNIQEGVDNCAEYIVCEETLDRLENLVKDVLADHSKADKLLPQTVYSYDDCYFEQLENTLKFIEKAREFIKKYEASIFYDSSW